MATKNMSSGTQATTSDGTESVRERMENLIRQLDAQNFHEKHPGNLYPVLASARKSVTLNGHVYEYVTGTAEHALFEKMLRYGASWLTPDEQAIYDRRYADWMEAEGKAMTQSNLTTGGILASAEFASEMLAIMLPVSPVRQAVTVVPIGQATGEDVPIRLHPPTARRVAETGSRAPVAGAADEAFGLEYVPVHELITSTYVSKYLAMDSHYDLSADLLQAFGQAQAKLEGNEFITGDGDGCMVGLDNYALPAGNVVTCADSSGHLVKLADIVKLLTSASGFYDSYLPDANLLMNPRLHTALLGELATSGAVYQIPGANDANHFFGHRVVDLPDMPSNLTPAANKPVCYLLHPSAYRLVVRQDVFVQRLTEMMGNQPLAEAGLIGYLYSARTGGQPLFDEGIARLVTA